MLPTIGGPQGSTATECANIQGTNVSADLIRRVIDERIRDESIPHTLIHQQVLDCLRVLPSKSYGDTSLSDNSNAILGDVYQFYNSDSNSEQHKILQSLQKRVEHLCQRQDDLDAQILHLSDLLKKTKEATSINAGEQTIDIPALIASLKVERCPEDVLQECEAIATARQFLPDQCIDTTSYLPDLEDWACTHLSGLLLLQAESMAEDAAKDSAVAIAKYLREASLPVACYFSDPQDPSVSRTVGIATIFQILVFQLISRCSQPQTSDFRSRAVKELRQGIPEDDSINLFRFLLKKVPRCFLIVEAPLQDEVDMSSKGCTQQLADIFVEAVQEAYLEGRTLKILMVHQDTITTASSASTADFNPVTTTYVLATPTPLARARVQAIRTQTDMVSILDRVVLITNERAS